MSVVQIAKTAGSMLVDTCPFCWLPFACFHGDGCGPDCSWRDCWGCSDPELGGWTVATALPFLGPRLPGGPLEIEAECNCGYPGAVRAGHAGDCPFRKQGGAP